MDKAIDYAPPMDFFRRLRVKRRALPKFGFRKTSPGWTYSEPVANGALTCVITVDAKGAVTENTVDTATKEEYVQHRIAAASGKFVGGVRRDVMALMRRIADACFERDVFKTALARDILSFAEAGLRDILLDPVAHCRRKDKPRRDPERDGRRHRRISDKA